MQTPALRRRGRDYRVWLFRLQLHAADLRSVIKVEQNRKDIQHLEGGIIQKIWVRDGDKVVKGQKLISLQGISINSNVDILSEQLNASLAMKARLEAERKIANAIS